MKNIHLIIQEKYADATKFEKIAEGMYKALYDYGNGLVDKGNFVTTLSFTLEEELNEIENRQYPLEDLLDKYYAHVAEFIQNDSNSEEMILELCTQNWQDSMEELLKIVGKRVYNQEVEIEGKTYIRLMID